jgi:Periplasmic binding protein-like domain
MVLVERPGLTLADGREAGEHLAGLPAGSRPTAVLCADDLLAIGVLQALTTAGLRVPEDMAIIGYDDIAYAAAAAVPLSSLHQPREALGATAAQPAVRGDPRRRQRAPPPAGRLPARAGGAGVEWSAARLAPSGAGARGASRSLGGGRACDPGSPHA